MTVDITISFIIRFLLVFIFARAVLHKLGDLSHFNAQLETYRLIPSLLVPAMSIFLILIEVFLAFSLLLSGWSYPSFIAAALLALYAGAISINLVRGRDDLDCGCDGPSAFAQRISWALVIRNCILAIFALATASPITSRSVSIVDITTVVFATIAVICIYASIEQAIANQQRQAQYFALRKEENRGLVK
jgi:Methylamine utilisation protein MauE